MSGECFRDHASLEQRTFWMFYTSMESTAGCPCPPVWDALNTDGIPGSILHLICRKVGGWPALSIVVGLSSLAHEHHEELKQVHEADVEAERAEDRDLLGHFRAPRLGILRLDPLGVIGDQA